MTVHPSAKIAVERRSYAPGQAGDIARREEVNLIDVLASSEDSLGTVGIDARKNVKRLASNIYWAGLQRLGICRFRGSQGEYHRWLEQNAPVSARAIRTDDGEPVGGTPQSAWHAYLPPPPPGFSKGVSFALRQEEADYLKERIVSSAPASMFALLVQSELYEETTAFPWDHPSAQHSEGPLKLMLDQARAFSDLMYPTALLYNLMLAEQIGGPERIEEYRSEIARWSGHLASRADDLARFELGRFWEVVARTGKIKQPTRQFVEAWLDLVPVASAGRVADIAAARRLIDDRERRLKGPLARLANRRALEQWGGASGAAPFNYRWGRAQRIVRDIVQPVGSA